MPRGMKRSLFILVLSACSMLPGKDGGSVRADDNGNVTMPDLRKMTREDAEAALRKAGITGSINLEENYTCDDPEVIEQRVCFTKPKAGDKMSPRIPVILYLRQKGTANYAMPDLKGKTEAEAREILANLKQIPQRLTVETMEVIMPDCEAKKVCRQDPKPGTMTDENDYKTLRLAPAE